MRYHLKTLLTVAAIAIPYQAMALDSGPRHITGIGCHNGDQTCFINVDGPLTGPAACKHFSIRWNVQTDPGGKNTLSLLTAAYLAGKTINLAIADTCYATQPTYPTFVYVTVQN